MIRPINVLTAMPTRGGVEVASRERGDRYEKCVNLEHDGYCKDLARPVIRRHDALQKVHDYDRGTIVAPSDCIAAEVRGKSCMAVRCLFWANESSLTSVIRGVMRPHKIHPTLGINKS